MGRKWLLFCPQLPANPSSPRVMVWRKMHSAGSLGLDNGLWILPYSQKTTEFLSEMETYVHQQGGTSRTFLADAFTEATEADIEAGFIQERNEEYFELKEQCLDFLTELDKETKRENFSFAEYEENEQDFEKLENWLSRVRNRDFADGTVADEAVALLEKCRKALQEFANQVFAKENPEALSKKATDQTKKGNRKD